MNESFEFRSASHFTAGAVGEPGRRVFYLQVGDESRVVSVKLEKQQVQALAQFLRTVMVDLPSPPGDTAVPDFHEPADAEWTVGQIAVGIDEVESKVVLLIEELADPSQETELQLDIENSDFFFVDESTGASIRAHVNLDLADSFIAISDELMSRGRPPCRLCGQPRDPEGHACPRLN